MMTEVHAYLPHVDDGSDKTNLWASALEKLSEADREKIVFEGQNQLDVLSQLQKLTDNAKDQCIKKRWRLTHNGKTIVLRDLFSKITVWIDTFKQIGDNAVQYDPGHAALPWAGIRFLLQIAVSDINKFAFVVEGAESISRLIGRYAIFEEIYLLQASDVRTELESALTRFYASILLYLSKARSFFEQSTATRVLKGVAIAQDAFEKLSEGIAAEQSNVEKFAALVDAESRNKFVDSLRLLSIDQDKKHDALLELLHTIDGPITRMSSQLNTLEDHLDNSKRIEILFWLSSQPYQEHHEQVSKSALAGTGRWLLEDHVYLKWYKESNSSLLWLHGRVGSGKSTLASIAVEDAMMRYKAGQSPVPAYFYCSRNAAEPERSDPASILASIVRQLSCLNNDLPVLAPVIDLYERKGQGFKSSGLRLEESCKVIIQITEYYPMTTIFVDALDEVDSEKRQDLLDAFEEILRDSLGLVKIFLSSRDDQDIVCALEEYPSLYIASDRNAADIETFVKTETDTLVRKRRLLHKSPAQEELKDLIIDKVSKGADGMFRWASLQLELLCAVKLDADVRATLGRLPPKLEQLYLEIYEKLMMSQPGDAGKAAISGVLKWLLCAQRQIKSSELRFAVALILDLSLQDLTKERILDLCHNFVVFDDGLDMFRFAHLSVREFLEKRPEYSQASSHLLAAEICLLKLIAVSKSPAAHSYITNECTMDVCEKLTSMTEKSSRELHDYATLFWKTHCQLAGEEQRTSNVHFEKMLRIFFFENSGVTSPLSTWVRSYRRNRNVRPGNAYILGSSLISSPNSMVRSYLLASACGFCDILRECLARSKLEDFEKDEGISLAALFCQGEAFRLLWSCQDHQNITENTLARAVSTLSEEDIEWLLAQTPKLKITVRVIQGAASREDSRVMKILLDRFEDLEITEEMLTRASWTGYLEAFNMLLTRAEGDVVFDKLLFDAVQGDGSSQIVMMLLDRFGYTHLTTDLLQHAMEHGSDDILQLLLDRSDDAVILKALFHSPDRLSGAASDTTLRQLLDRQSEYPQALLLAAVSKCSASIMPFILKRLGETAKVMLPDLIVRAASNTHDAPGVLDQLLRRAGNVEITEEMLMEAVHNYQFGNEVMKILLDEDREMEMTEEVLEAALRLLDFDETLLLLLERAKAIESSGRFFQAAASNRRCGAELVQWMMDHTKQDPEMTNKLIIWAAANVDNGLEIMLLLENKIGNIKYTDEVLSMVASHGAPQTLEYLLDRLDPTMITGNVIKAATANDIPISTHRKVKLLVARARDLSFDDDLLESAARNLEDINSFKLIWSRRRRKDVTQGLVQAAAENEAFNLEILSFLLHEVHDEDPDIILEENVLKALSGHAFCFHVLEGCLMTAMSKGVEVKVTQDMLTAAASKRFRYDDGRLLALLLKHSTGAVVADDIFTSAAGSGSDENLRVLSSYCGMDQTPPKYMNIARLRRAIEFWPDFDKNIDVVKELIEQGVNPNIPDESGHTPLFYAARDGLDTIVRQLLEAGADPNHRDEKGRTPLSRIKPFILLGPDKIAEALLSAGADPNSTSNYGWTPLFYAARYGHYELAKTLLAHGVSSRIEDEAGNTPSSVAKDYGKIKMYRLLERHQQS